MYIFSVLIDESLRIRMNYKINIIMLNSNIIDSFAKAQNLVVLCNPMDGYCSWLKIQTSCKHFTSTSSETANSINVNRFPRRFMVTLFPVYIIEFSSLFNFHIAFLSRPPPYMWRFENRCDSFSGS